jgi:2'-5' RNA ligase
MSRAPERLRLFVAVDAPPDQLEAVDDALEDLKKTLGGARWAPVANQHVTLKFLGSTPADLVDAVGDVCARAAAAERPSIVSIAGLGAFPSVTRARVLWAGIDDPNDLLATLARRLADDFAPLGYEPEKRSFTPHLTLARFKRPGRLGDLPELPGLDPFSVTELVLYRSRLSPTGARYEVVERYPIG